MAWRRLPVFFDFVTESEDGLGSISGNHLPDLRHWFLMLAMASVESGFMVCS